MKKLKYVKTFENYESEDTQENEYFKKVNPTRSIDKNFEIEAESIANLILNCSELSELKELATEVPTDLAEYSGELQPFKNALKKCFPVLDINKEQYVNTGTKIPFYGRAKDSITSHLSLAGSQHAKNIPLAVYIAQKVKNPGYKY